MAKDNLETEMNNEEFTVSNTSNDNSLNFIQKNSKLIIIVSIGIIAIVAIFAFIRYKNQEDSLKASTLMSRVLPYYEKADYTKALDGDPTQSYSGEPVKGLKFIASEYSNTEQGKMASFYVGNILLSTGKYSQASNYFNDASSSDSKVVQCGALAGKAACLEVDKKYEEAAKAYLDAARLIADDELQARYNYYAAYAYELASKKDDAEKLYRKVVLSSKFSEFAELAKEGLTRIGTIIE